MNGRDKCELLNEVRQKIAEKNNIEFTVYECTFEGDCTGTCPKCESEVRYLEAELAKKQARGEKINLEGIFTIEETCPTWIDNPDIGRELGNLPPRRVRDRYELVGDIDELLGIIKEPPFEKIPELEKEEAMVSEEIERTTERIKMLEEEIEARNEDDEIKLKELEALKERLQDLKLKLKNVRDELKYLTEELRIRESSYEKKLLLHEACDLKKRIQVIEAGIEAGNDDKERKEELKKLEHEFNNVMDKLEELEEKITD